MTNRPDNKSTIGILSKHLSRILVGMVAPSLSSYEIYDLIKDLSKSRTDLDEKITRAQSSLSETSELIAELESDLNNRVAKLERLKQEYDKYSKLAEVEEEKASAIILQIESAIGGSRGKERMIALAINLLAGVIVFVLGVILGPALTRWLGVATK